MRRVLLFAFVAVAAAQQKPTLTGVREMSQRLGILRGQGAPPSGERAGLVVAIRDTVREQIEAKLNSRTGAPLSTLAAALRAELAEAQIASQIWGDAVGGPFVRSSEGPAGPAVLASFVALDGIDGAPESKTWIWAFRERDGKFEAVDRTGSDFEGCGLFIEEIPAGRSGETWLLAWGGIFGANQSPKRMRVYSFDGAKFETIWSPPDRLQGKVRLKYGMVEVSYVDMVQFYERGEPPFHRHDLYALTVQGLVEMQSVLTEAAAIP
jgi:hypothetical protein